MNNRFIGLLLSAACIALIGQSFSAQAQQPSEEGKICLGCHGNEGLQTTFKDGETFELYINESEFRHSVHGPLDCSNCHTDFSPASHPHRSHENQRSYKEATAQACTMCHYFSEGIHSKMLEGLETLVCTDCHGAHAIKKKGDTENCLGCHSFGLSMTFRDGSNHSLLVDSVALKDSVHGSLRCADCHFGFSWEAHPERNFKSKRDHTITSSDACRRCHFDKYTKTLEGIHYNLLSHGNTSAPTCVDCHGAHTIRSGRKEKLLSARRCQQCHPDVYEVYTKSVHGEALLSEHNQDVPVCSDCHRTHDIADPDSSDFRNTTPDMCGNCHANEERMAKYGLSTAVLQSYLEDFHGVTATFYKKEGDAVRHIAVCTDCHGIHDITKSKAPNSTVLKANLLQRCQKCHPKATKNFPDSWISHYEPSIKRAPLVYMINLFYGVLIPFMMVGLVLQILLHIWRYAVNR